MVCMVLSLNYMKEYYNFHVSLIWCKCLLIFLYDALSTQREVFGVVNLSIWVLITSAYIQIVSFDYLLNIWLGTWYYSKMAKINIDINLDTFYVYNYY